MVSLYLRMIGARVRAQLQYRVSFLLDLFGFMLLTWIEFASLVVLLNRFEGIAGWHVPEVAILYGFSSIAFGLAEMFGRGFERIEELIQRGGFDSLLTRPLGSFFQVLTSEFQLRRLGRVLQGSLILGYAFANLPITWNPARLLIIPVTILSGGVIFTTLLMIGATITFWTIRTPEVINIFTSGGYQLSSYPLHIFQEWMRNLFLMIIPVAFSSYPAALFLLGRQDPHGLPSALAWFAPLAAVLFFGAGYLFWRIGVSKYTSTGT
ncbi:MAG: ABC transporter permease [Roseiflexaceae bacterium]